MTAITVVLTFALFVFGGLSGAWAADFKDKVKVEILNVGLHPGMDPGMYVCAGNHLHIKGTVQNLAGLSLGQIKVAGKAFGAGTAAFVTKQAALAPNEKAEINVEFLTVTGPMIQQVKRHEITVIDAPSKN